MQRVLAREVIASPIQRAWVRMGSRLLGRSVTQDRLPYLLWMQAAAASPQQYQAQGVGLAVEAADLRHQKGTQIQTRAATQPIRALTRRRIQRTRKSLRMIQPMTRRTRVIAMLIRIPVRQTTVHLLTAVKAAQAMRAKAALLVERVRRAAEAVARVPRSLARRRTRARQQVKAMQRARAAE